MPQRQRSSYASSFGTAAVAYAEHRPDYARAAVCWALDRAPGRRVLDLGAGTGKLTATLVAVGVEVVAVEPDAAMLSELHRALPAVRAVPGDAEGIPLADGSIDAVLAGNALHWFEMADAGPEIARVLAPEGVMAGLWNVVDDRVDWVAELARVSGSAAIGPRDTFSSWRAATADLHLARDGSVARFGSPEQREFAHGQLRTARSLVATLATRAGMLVMPEREREATLGRISAFLDSRAETVRNEFTLPMLTGVLRTQRL
jgi:SAM-dependent methyltransferase